MMWTILTAQIREDIYYSLINRRLFPLNRNNATREQDEQEIYYKSINILKESKTK